MFFVATEAHIYLDESGDTGWSFALPYPRGGSSRYLVIAASVLPPGVVCHPERLVRNLYKHRLWNSFNEKKWVHMSPSARTAFSIAAADLLARNPDIHLCGIIANKLLVGDHIYRDPTTLYNYMVKRLLLGEMAKHDRVNFRPDPTGNRLSRLSKQPESSVRRHDFRCNPRPLRIRRDEELGAAGTALAARKTELRGAKSREQARSHKHPLPCGRQLAADLCISEAPGL